jgi:hypothetical protein
MTDDAQSKAERLKMLSDNGNVTGAEAIKVVTVVVAFTTGILRNVTGRRRYFFVYQASTPTKSAAPTKIAKPTKFG